MIDDLLARAKVEQHVPDDLDKVASTVDQLLNCLETCEGDWEPIRAFETFAGNIPSDRFVEHSTAVVFTLVDGTKVKATFEVVS